MQITLPNEILLEEVASILAEGREVEIMSKGTSMLPFIVGDRDSVILKKEADCCPRPGDIVLARRNPGNAYLWRNSAPFARRCFLALYRRTIYKIIKR